jgi:hypothetical protein
METPSAVWSIALCWRRQDLFVHSTVILVYMVVDHNVRPCRHVPSFTQLLIFPKYSSPWSAHDQS